MNIVKTRSKIWHQHKLLIDHWNLPDQSRGGEDKDMDHATGSNQIAGSEVHTFYAQDSIVNVLSQI